MWKTPSTSIVFPVKRAFPSHFNSLLIIKSMNPLERCILNQIETILRPAQGLLRHSFFVPGGLFHDELWDWDSFWIAKGVFGFREKLDTGLQASFLGHAIGAWKNFFDHQGDNGAVPIMVKSDNPDFFGCTSEDGEEKNQAKPVFGQFALEICNVMGDFTWMEPYFERLLQFYARWSSQYRSACGLLVWGSDVANGVDNDPATYERPGFSSASLLLNCLYYKDLLATAQLADGLGRATDAARLRSESLVIGKAIQNECWDEIDGFFYTVDVSCTGHRDRLLPGLKKGMDTSWRTLPIKVKMFTGFLPIWAGIATEEQAQILVEKHLRNTCEFNAPWGLRSLAMNERMYEPEKDSANPSNWLGPVWIVANYMIYEGLKQYGYTTDCSQLASKIRALLEQDFQQTGTLHECYSPETAQPNFNANFLSWNVLALLMV